MLEWRGIQQYVPERFLDIFSANRGEEFYTIGKEGLHGGLYRPTYRDEGPCCGRPQCYFRSEQRFLTNLRRAQRLLGRLGPFKFLDMRSL